MARSTLLAGLLLAMVFGLPSARAASETALATSCFTTSDRVRLCYAAHLTAETTAPTLVFIPGWTMPAFVWAKQLAHFSGRYPLLALDPRGQGESAAPTHGYTLERRVQDIRELLDRFPGRRFVLVGWSLAVLETLAYIERYGPDRLQGLVLVDNSIGLGADPPPHEGDNPFFTELRTQREDSVRQFATAIFRTDSGQTLRDRIVASALKTDVEDSIRLLSYGKPRSYWRGIVQGIDLPILYAVTPRYADQATALIAQRPLATAEIFAEAGHALFWDKAERFNTELDAFIQRLATRP